ncbi:MAG TPA: cyclase family protein [Streptosporangiaceae bacterium]|nr:cyclase family protein [Streptosporangiaceae bacterium]
MTELPSYADLPAAPHGGRSAWGLFGPGDNLGLVNLMTPERIAAAARLVRRGQVFCLDMPLGSISPALAAFRGTPRHLVLHQPGTVGFDDVYDNFYPQAGSQWDSLGHVGYMPDQMYNGATEAEVLAGTRNTMEHWARHGIAGRAVLLDAERALRDAGRPYNPGSNTEIGVEELELARRQAGVEFAAGDIILLHTGFASWYLRQPSQVKIRLHGNVASPGLAHTEAVCEYLWDSHAAAVASDTYAVEAFPADRSSQAHPFGFLHNMLIGQLGLALGELWWLADLASDCAADGVHEMFLVSAPMNAPGGIGSPANAVAIK